MNIYIVNKDDQLYLSWDGDFEGVSLYVEDYGMHEEIYNNSMRNAWNPMTLRVPYQRSILVRLRKEGMLPFEHVMGKQTEGSFVMIEDRMYKTEEKIMSVEMKVKIKTSNFDVELTQEEARKLYDQLKEFFGERNTAFIPYTPFPNPYNPIYIGDVPPHDTIWTTGRPNPHVTFSCGGTNGQK